MTAGKARNAKHPPPATAPGPVDQAEIVPAAPFSIVGLGASAGGLEAYEQFFSHMPARSGLGFVLVSHLDPGHVSILTEILQRSTAMPVLEAQDQMRVAADTVYVIPPNRDMAIFHGALQLSMPEVPRGQRMPIDAFLRSLAEDQGERAVGIILSGTGTDGTLGLRAILGAGGVTLVQEPATAKYDGMPASAIKAGYASHVLPVEKMPATLVAGAHRQAPLPEAKLPQASAPERTGGLNRLLLLLRTATGHDFSLYKKSTIGRRIERRMLQHDLTDIDIYARYLKEHPAEAQALVKELLINVTSFFRDPEAFLALRQEILPQLFADKPEDYVFRVWVTGCATGEEAYSLAMLLREFMDESQRESRVQIYATDLDDDAIAAARTGLYPPNIAADLTPERLRRFFITEDSGYRIKKDIREMVVFAIQNVLKDPPFTKLDLVSCRNLMIYLEPELQDRLIPAFHYALKPGGVLFLSPSESIGRHPDLFSPLSRKWKIYRAVHSAASTRALMDSGLAWATETGARRPIEAVVKAKESNLAELTRRMLLETYAPASVVVDARGNILYVHGETGKYLRPAPGQASLNVVDMAREGLQAELRPALHEAANRGAPTLGRKVSVKTNGDFQTVSFSLRPLPDPDANPGLLLVSFQDVGKSAAAKRKRGLPALSAEVGRIADLERDLASTQADLQANIEEHQASNEELKSTNEELQSTNEELQSTNEELITVNSELQAKIEQLAGMQNDMKNLFDSINIGTLFLDPQMVIRRFSREATKVYRLVATDVGRPLADIKSDLEDDALIGEARAVLDSLLPCEREVVTAGGACYLVRIQPYRTLDNVIDGVVLTFTDISQRIEAETAEHKARHLAESIVDTVREPLVVLDGNMNIISASRSFYRHFRVAPEDTVGRCIYDIGNGQWNIPALRELLETLLPRDQSFEDFAIEHEFPVIGRCRMLLNARRLVGEDQEKPLILLAMEASRLEPEAPSRPERST